jgi:hypothetical protein
MSFRVKVKTQTTVYEYFAIASEACDILEDAYECFGVCGVSVHALYR